MIPFPTTAAERLALETYVADMLAAGVDGAFVATAAELARLDQGVYDLFELWAEVTTTPDVKAEVLTDIQDLVESHRRHQGPRSPR